MNKNRTINILSTSRTALILLLATLLTATTAQTARAQELTDFLMVSSSGTASGYFAFSDHFYKVDWTGINTAQTTSVQLNYNSQNGNLRAYRNGNTSSYISLYTNADVSWGTSDITGLTPGQSSDGYTTYDALSVNVGTKKAKVCTVTCMAANTPTWNWSADYSTCTATFTCTASPSLTTTVDATVTRSGSTATASATFNGTNYTDTKTIVTNYSITYVLNGGTNAAGNPTTYADNVGVASFANPTRTGYTFAGWYDNASFTGSPVTSIPAGSSGNKTLYAKWTSNTYTVSYNANGGSGTMSSQTFTYDAAQNLRANTFTRTGYTFGGWATTANGAVAYADKQSVSNLTSTQGADVELFAKWMPSQTHFSQSGDTYTIKTTEGWNVFCDLLADNTKGYFSGKTVQLGADITVTRMAGGDNHDFTGTFDGNDNTLTFSHTATDNYCAPFRNVQGASAETPAVISNLNVVSTVTAEDYRHPAGLIALQSGHVSVTDCNVEAHINCTKGTANPSDLYPAALVSQSNGVLTVSGCTTTGQIATDGKYAAGLIGIVQNTATIENCRVSVTIQSTTSGDGTHGGLVASQASKTTITITGCLFDGRLLGSTTNKCGGFIGWRGATATIYNSLFVPAEVTVQNSGSATFARNDVDNYNCYYTTLLNDGTNYAPALADGTVSPAKWHNGKATRTVTAGDNVTIEAVALTGTATQYTVSGITAYSGGGLQRGETLYYGIDDQLSLTLSNTATGAPQGYQYAYTASAGTLSGTTLTMPDENVTISVNTAALAPIDWATVNQGNSADPYMIYNKDQLLLLAHRVNGTNGETANNYQYKYFKLGADITFSHPDNEGDDYAENYEAIGGYIGGTERYFCGYFDGDGHTVSGIRIRKTGSGDADDCQGLFGQTFNADIHDVHLTDARIKGYHLVGGIAGYNPVSTIIGCTVTDSYITADNYYGTICGTNNGERLTNNYYHGCTVNGTTVTSGKGCEGADITDNNGALPAYAITFGDGVSTNALASVPENGFVYNGVSYYREGLALPLASTLGSEAPEGYTLSFSANGTALSGNTYTVNATDGDVTISALAPIDWATVNEGTSADPYMIYNKDQLLLLAHRVNGTNGETANNYWGKFFKLGADITFTHDANEGDDYAENYEAIGYYDGGTNRYFCGYFDGANHTVSGIRIRKTGSGNADSYQGLFGFIDNGANIRNVHLTDARITGYQNVGGIAGINNGGYIMRCTVTDSYITSNWNYGTICGSTFNTTRLINNYYHGCTVNGTAVTSGVGCHRADIADNNGALPAYRLDLGANITTPPGTFAGQTEWLDTPPVDPRLAPENGFTLAGNHYFASGYEFTPGSTLASGAAQGYTPRATLGDQLLDPYTPTGDTDLLAGKAIARLTITADCDGKTLATAIRSDGLQHEVSYIKADGTTQTAQAIALDGHEAVDGAGEVHLAAGTYYVGTDITYANKIVPDGEVALILANGKTMTLNGNDTGIDGGYLTIYGQSLDAATAGTLRYDGTWNGIYVSNYEQHSGNVSITTPRYWMYGIFADDVTLRGGTLTISANGDKASAISGGMLSILGGQFTATATGTDATGILAYAESGTAITLGWTRPADRITASSISTGGGTVAVADGQALTDGSGNIYTGTLTADDLAAIGGQTLQPCLALAITYNSGSDCVWTTCVAETDCTVPEGLTAYTVGQVTASEAVAEPVDYLPKGVPVLLCRTATATTSYAAVPCTVSKPFSGGNLLRVATESTTVADGCAYVLYRDEFVLAAGGTLPAGVVYLPVGSAASSARRLVISHGTTAIADAPIARQTPAEQAPSSAGWYAVDGRRLDGQPTAKGLYIHGGKKVIVK